MKITHIPKEWPFTTAGFRLAKHPVDQAGGRSDEESQDHAAVCAGDDRILAVISDGVTTALRGGMAARIAVDFAEQQFQEGVNEARPLLAAACRHLWKLNQDYMETEGTESLAYQCMISLATVDPQGHFEWASVGDSVIESNHGNEITRLTGKAEVTAERLHQRAGMPLEYLQLFSGESSLDKHSVLRLYTDGFNEWYEDCIGKTMPQIERMLKRASLNDDVTLIELKRV